MTRPQKCKRGLRQTANAVVFSTYINYDPTAEMQKGIKTDVIMVSEGDLILYSHDPTAEMQKGIKTDP